MSNLLVRKYYACIKMFYSSIEHCAVVRNCEHMSFCDVTNVVIPRNAMIRGNTIYCGNQAIPSDKPHPEYGLAYTFLSQITPYV